MIISTKTLVVSLILTVSSFTAFAKPVSSDCNCKNNNELVSECPSQVNSPTWWSWITTNKSSQFHFFQLIELIRTNEVTETTAKEINKSEEEDLTS